MIVSELLKPHLPKDSKLSLTDFMFEHEDDRKARARRKLINTLEVLSVRESRKAP